VLRDQVPDPAKHKNEIEPSENKSGGGRALIFAAAFGSQRGKRREEENQESARKDRLCAPPGLHRTSRAGAARPGRPSGKNVSAISPASTTLDCSSDARAASTSAASAFFAACNSRCAAKRCRAHGSLAFLQHFPAGRFLLDKNSPRTFRSACCTRAAFLRGDPARFGFL